MTPSITYKVHGRELPMYELYDKRQEDTILVGRSSDWDNFLENLYENDDDSAWWFDQQVYCYIDDDVLKKTYNIVMRHFYKYYD